MTTITNEDAFNVGLPKWPQMLVAGKKITEEQAKEIIFATDRALINTSGYNGNDREYEKYFAELTHYSRFNMNYNFKHETDEERDLAISNRKNIWAATEEFEKRAGFLRTEYVYNAFAISAFVYGPAGWCHPDGTISFVHNVGKWPSVKEVFDEWVLIATRWPFLDLTVTLMSGESCEDLTAPLVTFIVSEGKVNAVEPTVQPFEGMHLEPVEIPFARLVYDKRRERGLPESWMTEFADKIRPLVDEICTEFNVP